MQPVGGGIVEIMLSMGGIMGLGGIKLMMPPPW